MAKRVRPKDPRRGSKIPSSQSGGNSQLSRWRWWKTIRARIWNWLPTQLTISLFIALAALSWAIYSNNEQRRRHQEVIDKIEKYYKGNIRQSQESNELITQMLQQQNQYFENQRILGNLTSGMMALITPPSNGASGARGAINVTPAGVTPKQFIVTGNLDRISQGKGWWIGTLSGLRFWPQIELPTDIREGQPFKYRVTIPSNIASGELVLMEAGPKANQLFKEQMVSPYYPIGLLWPHLKDAQVLASVNFQ